MSAHSNGVASSVVEVIGGTPTIELARLTRGMRGRIVAKLDYLNPGFSKKDRIARQIIDDGIAAGDLGPGQTVVELTSATPGPVSRSSVRSAATRSSRSCRPATAPNAPG
jgi:cysteine synthase